MASVPESKETSKLTSDGEVELNFGEVPVQTSASKWIELHNVSPVSTVLCDMLLSLPLCYACIQLKLS